ncbi:hypothetical protein Tco_1266186 [Tanacetum coccineum]
MGFYEIHKADGTYKTYKFFSEMLNDFDRDDLIVLYRLFNEMYASTRPGFDDLMLWGDMKIMFDPDENGYTYKNALDGNFYVELCAPEMAYELLKFIRHPDAAIDDPRPAAGSFNMTNVRCLSAHVIKLRDMPEGVLVLSGLSRVWKNRLCGLVLRGVDRNVMGIHNFICLPEWTGAEVQEEPHLDDLAVGTPSSKITAKAKASQKLKASTYGVASAFVASGTRVDSQGKGIMVDDVVAPSGGVSRQRPSSRPASSFRDVSGDAIYTDFFPFSAGPYYATYPEDGVAGNCEFTREELDAPYRPTFGVQTKEVFKDLALYSRLKGYEEKVAGLTRLELQVSTLKKQVYGLNDNLANSNASFAKSKANGKERKKKIKSLSKSLDNLHSEVARLFATLNQATILEAKRDEEILLLKATPSEFSSFFRGQFQGLSRSFLLLMSLVEFKVNSCLWILVLDLSERLVEASPLVAQTDYAFLNKIFEYAIESLSVILQLEPEKLVRPANVPIPRDTRVSPPITKESTVIPISKSLELSANVVLASFVVALEQNEEQGTSYVLDDVAEVTVVGSERGSFGFTDVVVALSASEKGDGSAPSTVEKFGFAPGALLVALPFLLLLVSSIDGLVLIPTDTSWLRNSSFIVSSLVNTSAFRFKIFGRCVIQNMWNRVVASIISPLYLLSCSVAKAASPANSTSQSMAWLDTLNFNWMAYEYIFSLGLTRIIPTLKPSSIVSLPKYNL